MVSCSIFVGSARCRPSCVGLVHLKLRLGAREKHTTLGRATTTASSPSLNMPLHNDNFYFGYASLMLTRATFFIAFEHSGWSVRVVTRKAPA